MLSKTNSKRRNAITANEEKLQCGLVSVASRLMASRMLSQGPLIGIDRVFLTKGFRGNVFQNQSISRNRLLIPLNSPSSCGWYKRHRCCKDSSQFNFELLQVSNSHTKLKTRWIQASGECQAGHAPARAATRTRTGDLDASAPTAHGDAANSAILQKINFCH